jgi:hypothetical protein
MHSLIYETDANLSTALPPKAQEETPLYHAAAGAKRTKIRYGPYRPPSVKAKNIESLLLGEGGMMDASDPNGLKPCEDECWVTWMRAGLEYANGSAANVDSGMWLHHVVLSLKGADGSRRDTVCPSMKRERIFSSGNERTVVDMTDGGRVKAGYLFRKQDQLKVDVELENQNVQSEDVYLTMTYEHVPRQSSNDFKNVTAMWFDVSNCGPSFVFPGKTQQFSYTMKPWTASFSGETVFVGGHLHDGGTNVVVTQNQKTVCDSVATYGSAKEFVTITDGRDKGMLHISNMTACHQMGRISKGDVWDIQAGYDLAKYKPMSNEKGRLDMVMGIAIMYATVEG